MRVLRQAGGNGGAGNSVKGSGSIRTLQGFATSGAAKMSASAMRARAALSSGEGTRTIRSPWGADIAACCGIGEDTLRKCTDEIAAQVAPALASRA